MSIRFVFLRGFCRSLAIALVLSLPTGAEATTSLQPAYDDCPMRGPQSARGVIVYSHGRSLTGEDSASPAPAYLRELGNAGWDVLRFNRPSAEDTLPDSSGELARRVQALKAQGYRRVILAGQSFGAFLSIMAAAKSGAADGVIATAPAAFGNRSDSPNTWQMNATELYRRLGELRNARVLLGFFDGDVYDPGGRATVSADLLARNGDSGVIIDRPSGMSGHLAAAGSKFARRYGPCLMAFVEAVKTAQACPESLIVEAGPANSDPDVTIAANKNSESGQIEPASTDR